MQGSCRGTSNVCDRRISVKLVEAIRSPAVSIGHLGVDMG